MPRISRTPLEVGLGRLGAVVATTAPSLPAIQSWMQAFAALEARTNQLLATRNTRFAAMVTRVNNAEGGNTQFLWYRCATPAEGCPPTGNFALSWGDIFNEAKALLSQLAALPPVPWTAGADVIRWFRAVQWNVILLRDATNVRGTFLWPTAVTGNAPATDLFPSAEEQRRGATTTLYVGSDNGITEGSPYPCGSGGGCGAPLAIKELVARADEQLAYAYTFPVWNCALDFAPPSFVSQTWMNGNPGRFTFASVQRPGAAPGAIVDSAVPISEWGAAPETKAVSRLISDYWRANAPVKIVLYGRSVFWDVGAMIRFYQDAARIYAAQDIGAILADSIGWYLYNHVEYWKNRGVITLDENDLRDMQNAMQDTRMRSGLGVAAGAVRLVAGMVNPLAGAIAGALSEIGFAALGGLINLDVSGPKRLFLRNFPASCHGVEGDGNLLTEAAGVRTDVAARAAAEALARQISASADRSVATDGAPPFPWGWVVGGAAGVLGLVALLRRR